MKLQVQAEDDSMTVVCISSIKDIALFLRDNELLFNEKVMLFFQTLGNTNF